jgi:3',5'-cyclic AMP phosphodiesterase CpdA
MCTVIEIPPIKNFIQLSDLHIHHNVESGENVALDNIVRGIVEKYNSDDTAIIITGDIVDDGSREQYERVVPLLFPLVEKNFSILPCPGNHDYGPKGNIYTESAQNRFQQFILRELIGIPKADNDHNIMEEIYPLIHHNEEIVFIGLDTIASIEDGFMHFAAGKVGERQLDVLADFLSKDQNDRNVIVYMHHHPFCRALGLQMVDAPVLMNILKEKIDLLCFGHKHLPEIWLDSRGINWILAADKTTRLQSSEDFTFYHVEIKKKGSFVISNIHQPLDEHNNITILST